jgi:uncharacterized protein
MKISTRQLRNANEPYDFAAEGAELGLEAGDIDGVLSRPVRVRALAVISEDRIVISGTIDLQVGLVCSRCQEDFSCDMASPFSWYCQPQTPGADTNDDEVLWYNPLQGFIDITARVREQIILAMPLKPLCRKDCAGLCPVCGTNQNVQSCGCNEGNAIIHRHASNITIKQG